MSLGASLQLLALTVTCNQGNQLKTDIKPRFISQPKGESPFREDQLTCLSGACTKLMPFPLENACQQGIPGGSIHFIPRESLLRPSAQHQESPVLSQRDRSLYMLKQVCLVEAPPWGSYTGMKSQFPFSCVATEWKPAIKHECASIELQKQFQFCILQSLHIEGTTWQ